MNIKIKFENNPGVFYPIVDGATFIEVLGEELDSATIIIPQVSEDNRLSNLKPYEFARIFIDNKKGKLYIVDDFIETLIDVKNKIYKYTINLMSETKLLEKIQLPNKVFTHSLVSGQLNLSQAVGQLVDLYAPLIKCKMNQYEGDKRWETYQLFSFKNAPLIFEKVKLKDLSLSKPTLRQALTAISTQVGYIPYLEERELKFKKLEGTGKEIDVSKVSTIQKSMSSDSYMSTLQTIVNNVLDDNNYVRNEFIGFRDYDDSIIKQKENCYISTDFPIYSVKKLTCGFYSKLNSLTVKGRTKPNDKISGASSMTYDVGSKKLTIKFDYSDTAQEISIGGLHYNGDGVNFPDYETYTIKEIYDIKIRYLNRSGDELKNGLYVVKEETITTSSLNFTHEISNLSRYDYDAIMVCWKLKYHYKYWCNKEHSSESLSGEDHTEVDEDRVFDCALFTYSKGLMSEITTTTTWTSCDATFSNLFIPVTDFDITPLVKEANERKLLSVDYTNIKNNIDAMSKNYYTTLQYKIGDNIIEGFSNSWSLSVLWWKQEYTLGQMIVEVLSENYDTYAKRDFANVFGLPSDYTNFAYERGNSILTNKNYFTGLFFSISYVPLNNLNVKYSKENMDSIPLDIAQLDTNQNGIVSLDDFSLVERDNLNRMANPMYIITQRVTNVDDIFSVGDEYNGAIIFKRVVAYYKDFIQCSYYASEDYVIKNYSTSIQTKYRAYEYVDYSQSVERKENIKVYALIAPYYLTKSTVVDVSNMKSLLMYQGEQLTYGVEKGSYSIGDESKKLGYFKFDLSVVTALKSLLISFQERDNVSAGAKIAPTGYSDYVGGLPQQYYVWDNMSSELNIVSYEALNEELSYSLSGNDDDYYSFPIFQVPLMMNGIGESMEKIIIDKGNLYRDLSERFNFTLQIEFYSSDKNNVQISDWYPEICCWYQNTILECVISDNEGLEDISNEPINVSETFLLSGYIDSIENIDVYPQRAKIKFNIYAENKWLRVLYNNNGTYYEAIRFNLKYSEYYVSLNDHKGEKVYDFSGDVPTSKDTIKRNGSQYIQEVN